MRVRLMGILTSTKRGEEGFDAYVFFVGRRSIPTVVKCEINAEHNQWRKERIEEWRTSVRISHQTL